MPCTLKERADTQFACPRCGARDFRVAIMARVLWEIRCSRCNFFHWLDRWDDGSHLEVVPVAGQAIRILREPLDVLPSWAFKPPTPRNLL